MTASYSKRFLKQYAAAPLTVRKAFDKQAGLLIGKLNHPSLHAKKYDEISGRHVSIATGAFISRSKPK
jgi:hypothetical protein